MRDPVDVARSLERRDRFPLAKGVWLWANHLAALLDASIRDPLLILYEDLLRDPRATVDRLITHLRLQPPSEGAARAAGLVRGDGGGAPPPATGVARAAREAYELVRTGGLRPPASVTAILRQLDDDLRPRLSESWEQRTERMLEAITRAVPAGSTIAVIDDGSLQLPPDVRGCRVLRHDDLPGVEGPPADGAGASARLARIRDAGASHVAISWTSTWWIDHFAAFASALRSGGEPVLADERVTLFALGAPTDR
ncbi:MAG: sulfotransferase [Actinobacteria bacterium]|nr:sulfotransferase [Actinomycetota bacterium]